MKIFGFLVGFFGIIVLECFANGQISCSVGQRFSQNDNLFADMVETQNCSAEEICHRYDVSANTQGFTCKWTTNVNHTFCS